MIQSRWEDLSGNLEVCKCCTSKCKGAKAIVSTSPLVVVDKLIEVRPSETQEASSAPVADPMQSQRVVTQDTLVSGNAALRPTQVVSQQDATPSLWLPGQVQDTERSEKIGSESKDNLTMMLQASDAMSNELQPSTTDQEPLLNTPTNMVIDQSANELGSDGHKWDLHYLTLVDGWAIPQQSEKAAFAEESQRKKRFGRSGLSDAEVPQDDDFPLTANMNANVNQNDCNALREELAAMPQEEANAAQPIVRAKLQFAKGMDGSQTLSYEEEVLKQEVKGVTRRFWLDGTKRKAEPRQRGLQSIFLDLLRRMDKAE
ncbi:zona pellucida protein C isoform X2 [Cyclopterus lumpus]|uniref:zona pellucida protein C isoform X2 n=1 Tax=Cyclopterus lumpus TaxID=8103 RepID=UPI0014874BFB|nr:zona pellucida protein C isoform X2 [Cyclopterus lumpus]